MLLSHLADILLILQNSFELHYHSIISSWLIQVLVWTSHPPCFLLMQKALWHHPAISRGRSLSQAHKHKKNHLYASDYLMSKRMKFVCIFNIYVSSTVHVKALTNLRCYCKLSRGKHICLTVNMLDSRLRGVGLKSGQVIVLCPLTTQFPFAVLSLPFFNLSWKWMGSSFGGHIYVSTTFQFIDTSLMILNP